MNHVKINKINFKRYWYFYILFIFLLIIFVYLFFIETNEGPSNLVYETSTINEKYELKIGVLAKNGEKLCMEQWESTAEYLTENIDNHVFSIVPLKFAEVNTATANSDIDFLLVNSAMYVEQEVLHNASSIATLKNFVNGEVITKFAGVIFTKKDNIKINDLDDLQDTSLAAVNKDSLGGWMMANYEFLKNGIDPYDTFSKIDFLEEHDNVVYAVLDGTYDVGTIRSDTLEKMRDSNLIDLDDIKVLNEHQDSTLPVLHSTTSFPSWPMAKTSHISEELGLEVAVALINVPANSQAAKDSKSAGWTLSLNYQSVHILLQDLKVSPYENFGQVTFIDILIEYRWAFIILVFSVICLIAFSLRMGMLKDKLQEDVKKRIIIEDKLEKAKEDAEASNKNLVNTIEALTHPFYVIDINTYEIIIANSAAKELNTYDSITTCYRLTHRCEEPCGSGNHPCPLVEVKKTRKPCIMEHIHYDKNNVPRIMEVHGYPIFNDNGELVQMIEYSIDITEKKAAEEATKKSEEKFRIIADYTYDWECWFSNEGKLLWTNPAVERFTGYNIHECYDIEYFPMILFSGEDRDKAQKMFTEAVDGSIGNDEVIRIDKKDGSEIWGAFSWNPVFDDDGNKKGFRSSVRDVTERNAQEEEVKKALNKVETLYKSSLALRSTMDLNEVLKIILTSLKEVVPFNTATIEEVYGDSLRIIHCEGYLSQDKVVGTEFPIRKGTFFDEIVNDRVSIIIPDVRKEDGFVDMSEGKMMRSFMGVPLVMNDEIIGVLTIDSYELNSYNEELADLANAFASQAAIALNNARNFEELKIAKEDAEAATKAKGDFLANMSHEIRTPMNAVIGLNSLLERTELKSKQKDYVIKIGRSAKNLLNIINDILDFSKIESGKLEIENVDFNLEDVLENLSVVLALKAYERGVELVVTKDKKVPIDLIGDSLRVGQVLLNLANNAIKFTDEGEVIIKVVNIEETDKDVLLKFSIKDSGIGMTKEQVSKLFQAFAQADVSTTRKYGGTGLGLSISKNLVNLMGGNIGVDSVFGEGSEFYFTLRFEKSKAKIRKREVIPNFLLDLKVLIVEDNEYAREVLSSYLEGFSTNPVLVASGEEAISDIKNHDNHYDLILMDWKMPGMNGIDTWKQMKITLGERPLPKIILVTAYGKDELFEQVNKEGFSDLLTKPVSQSTIFDSIIRVFSDEVTNLETSEKGWNYPDGFEEIRGAKILLVEDNEVNQQVASETLEIEGFWIDIAGNGQIAVDKVAQNIKYDIILMDLQMPILDGYEASRKIRGELNVTDIPIIALSADAMSGTRDEVLEAGMVDYVSKPIDKMELFTVMVKWIKPGDRKRNVVDLDTEFVISKEIMEEKLKNIDVQDGTYRIAGNLNAYLGILKKFSKNNKEFANTLNQYIKEDRKEESKRLVHTIKGVSGNIGAKTLNYMVKNLEKTLKSENRDNDMLKVEIDSVSNELDIIFSQIKNLIDYIDANSNSDAKDASIDKQELLSKLEELKGAIEEYDTTARQRHEELKKYMPAYEVGDEYEQLGDCIVNYNFDTALELCEQIIMKIN